MTNIGFYKLSGDQQSALKLVCQLIKKAQNKQQQVLCLVPDNKSAESLDNMLWGFEPTEFIPHGCGADHYPVAIISDPEPMDHHQILINLQPEIPSWFSRFERVIEIIYKQADYEQAKRNNFRFYKERGYPLSFHDLTKQFAG